MTSLEHWPLGVLVGGLLLGSASLGSAQSFRTAADLPEFDDDARVGWRDARVTFAVHGSPAELTAAEVGEAAEAAAATWTAVPCAELEVVIEGAATAPAVASDGRNTLGFVHDWVARGFDPEAAATTDVVYAVMDGDARIVEADILVNAEAHRWSLDGAGDTRDLQSVLTHELGHALGLLHPCGEEGAPACDGSFDGSLMHPEYMGVARDLSASERDGLCFLDMPPCSERCDGECVGTQCLQDAPLGDPCTSALECPGGVCLAEGCSRRCTRDCDGSWSCEDSVCVPTGWGYGADCERGEECASGLCLQDVSPHDLCTRECGTGCPTGDECGLVDGRAVCVPPAGGCTVAALAPGEAPMDVSLVGMLMWLGARSRRWRKKQ